MPAAREAMLVGRVYEWTAVSIRAGGVNSGGAAAETAGLP